MSRFKSNLYTKEKIRYQKAEREYIRDGNGYLYAQGIYPTKIKAEDLPEWYVYGRYYKQFGYLSAKGVVDMVYIPCTWNESFLKYDNLLISYHDRIIVPEFESRSIADYAGYDEHIDRKAIIDFIKAANKYSNYDILSLIRQLQTQIERLQKGFPDKYHESDFNIVEWFD